MKPAAHVQSLEAILLFRQVLAEYQSELREAATALSLELQRAMDWIEHDRPRYWNAQFQQASERLTEARGELERCETSIRPEDRPSCLVQKKAYERAKRRLRLTEEKQRLVRHWRIALQQEAQGFRSRLAKIRDVADTDLPRALAALDRIIAALERYLNTSE